MNKIGFIEDILKKEELRQENNIELIASENFVSNRIKNIIGNCFTNKYAEGYPNDNIFGMGLKGRYYGGCQNVDLLENYCKEAWREVFKTDYHVNVQPHSGTNANLAAYTAVLKVGDTILSMSLDQGGHLSHGSKANLSGKLYNIISYNLNENGLIDYEDFYNKIIKYKPKLIIVGASAYSRTIHFNLFKKLIDKAIIELNDVNYKPLYMADIAHIAGLIAAEEHPTPFGYCDIITTTTHKTLRGPRGALIFCKPELADKIDKAVFPGVQGGPLMHIIAGKAACAEEANSVEFKKYIHQVKENAYAMCEAFRNMGYKIVSNTTDNHLFIVDLSDMNLTGLEVQEALDKESITVNKNCVPNEKLSPKLTSGIRIGTAAMTTLGYKEGDFIGWAYEIDHIIRNLQKEKENG